MDKFENGIFFRQRQGGLAHHPEKRYTLTALGVPACSGKMNNIVKNYKDYCMDIIGCHPHGCRFLVDCCVKKRELSGVDG